MRRRPPRSTPFPYTTLFRSLGAWTPAEACLGHQRDRDQAAENRSEEHTSELQSPYVISYAVFCLKKNYLRWCLFLGRLTSRHKDAARSAAGRRGTNPRRVRQEQGAPNALFRPRHGAFFF